MGDAVGTVTEANDRDMRAWVHFPGFGYAQGWSLAEFEIVEAADEKVLELLDDGCSDEG